MRDSPRVLCVGGQLGLRFVQVRGEAPPTSSFSALLQRLQASLVGCDQTGLVVDSLAAVLEDSGGGVDHAVALRAAAGRVAGSV